MPLKEMPVPGTRVVRNDLGKKGEIKMGPIGRPCPKGFAPVEWDNGDAVFCSLNVLDLETPEPTTTKVPLREKIYGNADDMHTAHLKSQAEATEAQRKREVAQWEAARNRMDFSAKNARVHFFLTGETIDREVFGEGD